MKEDLIGVLITLKCKQHLKVMTGDEFMQHIKEFHDGKTWRGYEIEQCHGCKFIALNDMEMPHHRLFCEIHSMENVENE